jgi:hypothetical protein
MMKISNFEKYGGLHCESSTTGSLLKHLGINLSEAMIIGLSEAFNFTFLENEHLEFAIYRW